MATMTAPPITGPCAWLGKDLATSDIQLPNNHVIYHARTAFEDDPRTQHDRGSIEPGALRGGIAQFS